MTKMKPSDLSKEQIQELFELFDRGIKPKGAAQETGIEYKVIVSVRAHQYVAYKRGFESAAAYKENWAREKGFESHTEYRKCLEHSKSIDVIVSILNEKGASAKEVSQEIKKRLGFSVKPSTIERKIRQFQSVGPWVNLDEETKKYTLDKDHWFVTSMMQELS